MPIPRFAEAVASFRTIDIPEAARAAARRCVVDWFAATVPGGLQPPATLLAEALAEDLGPGRAMLVPGGRRTTMRTAALINGAASHTVEFDDIYSPGLYHPGSPVVAAALAAAQARRASGDAFLRGVVAGYEVSNRIARAVVPAHYDYWHTTGTIGCFGAAAAASYILGLDAGRTAHAMATAGTMAAALQQAFRADAMSKPLHAGRAAETGCLTALAAERGVTGALDILEGPRGFGNAMSRDVDWEKAPKGLGEEWTVVRTTQKNHGSCGHNHAVNDGVIALRNAHGLTPDNVRRIRAGTYAKGLEVCANRNPRTAFEAKFSLAYCAAAALVLGRVRVEAFTPERLADPTIRSVMERIELYDDAEATAAFPSLRGGVVEIETTDGRTLTERVPTRKGDPDNALTEAEIVDKFKELAEPAFGPKGAAALLERLLAVDAVADMSELGAPALAAYPQAAQ